MRRVLGFMLALGLLVGGATACGSSSGGDKSSATTAGGDSATTTASGNGSSGGGKVADYCKAVDDYVAKVKAAKADPSKAAALAADGQDLAKKAAALATGLSASDAQKVADCTKKSTDALTGG